MVSGELVWAFLAGAFDLNFHPGEYIPSGGMNRGMEFAGFGLRNFPGRPAAPRRGRDWLSPLANALLDFKVAAVSDGQIPRPDVRAVFAHDYERCFGPNRESAKWEHFFSMVNSGIRKDIWAKRGFNERMQYSEDDEYTRRCRAQGYHVIYVPSSVVMHSHNYTPAQAWKRSFGEGRARAAVWKNRIAKPTWGRNVFLGWMNDARRDLRFCTRTRRLNEWPHALRIRWQQRSGALSGFRSGWKDYRQPRKDSTISPPTYTADLQH